MPRSLEGLARQTVRGASEDDRGLGAGQRLDDVLDLTAHGFTPERVRGKVYCAVHLVIRVGWKKRKKARQQARFHGVQLPRVYSRPYLGLEVLRR